MIHQKLQIFKFCKKAVVKTTSYLDKWSFGLEFRTPTWQCLFHLTDEGIHKPYCMGRAFEGVLLKGSKNIHYISLILLFLFFMYLVFISFEFLKFHINYNKLIMVFLNYYLNTIHIIVWSYSKWVSLYYCIEAYLILFNNLI